jgi:hypothetical protein
MMLHAARYAAGECRHGERKRWGEGERQQDPRIGFGHFVQARRRAGQKGRARPAATHVGSRKRLIGPRETSLDGRRGFADAGLALSRNRWSRGRRVTEAIRPLHASVRLPGAQRTLCLAFPEPGPAWMSATGRLAPTAVPGESARARLRGHLPSEPRCTAGLWTDLARRFRARVGDRQLERREPRWDGGSHA